MEVLSMKDINLDGLDNIKADKQLIEKAVKKVMNNNRSKNYFNIKRSIAVAASLMVIVGSIGFYSIHNKKDLGIETASKIVTDSKAIPSKPVEESKATSDKTTSDSKITINKPVADNKVTPSKPVEGSKAVTDSKTTPSKEEADSNDSKVKVTTDSDKPVAGNKITNHKIIPDGNVVNIPAISINPSSDVDAKMFALVVYKGKIYAESNTQLDLNNIKNFLGEKVGSTTNTIDEWNVSGKSSEELASNIGEQEIYTVKGYDSDFRIMSYTKNEDQEYAQFFDCLNGITVKSGKDIFGKLNLVGNIESAKFITFDDFNNGTNNYVNFESMDVLNEASNEFNNAVPYNYEAVEKDIESCRNNNDFREFTLKLKDGLMVKFTAFKKGYVCYGNSNIYFKVQSSTIDKLW
jgi:hypothetical protein